MLDFLFQGASITCTILFKTVNLVSAWKWPILYFALLFAWSQLIKRFPCSLHHRVVFSAITDEDCHPQVNTSLKMIMLLVAVDAEVVLKATNVDGVYDSDPKTNKAARLLHHVSYSDVAVKRLSVMDITAITLCQENHIPGIKTSLHIDMIWF